MSNKAIICLLVCLCGIIFSTLLLLKKDVRRSNSVTKNQIPYEVQSASAQNFLSNGQYDLANKIFENSFKHFRENPAFIEKYAVSLNSSGKEKEALKILKEALGKFPLNKNLRLISARTFILNQECSKAYDLLTSVPIFNHKDPEFLSLVILTTPNEQALDSLMIKMKAFQNFENFFDQGLVEKSINRKFLERFFSENG